MNANAIRLRCPECGFETVQTEENTKTGGLPVGVIKQVYESYCCPNGHGGDVYLVPAGVTDPHASRPAVPRDVTPANLEQWRVKLGELERACEASEALVKRRTGDLKDAKAVYDSAVVSLRTALHRFTGDAQSAPGPLLELAEQAETDLGDVAEPPDLTAEQIAIAEAGPVTAVDLAAAAVCEELRVRLAQVMIVATIEEIAAWPLEDYHAVVRYVAAIEDGADPFALDPPACLPTVVPDHIRAVFEQLQALDILVALGTVCAWTQAQRDDAATWAALALSGPVPADSRPSFLPAPEPEPQRTVSRRRKGPPRARREAAAGPVEPLAEEPPPPVDAVTS